MHMNMEYKKESELVISTSKEALSAKKFIDKINKKFPEGDTPLMTRSIVEELLKEYSRVFMPGVTVDDVMKELITNGFIVEPVQEKETIAEEVVLYRATPKPSGLKIVDDEAVLKILEDNKFMESLEKEVFKNTQELDRVYEQALTLGSGSHREIIESNDNYYQEFAHLIKGGQDEINKDLESLKERKDQFKKNNEALDPEKALKLEQTKKVATIVERAIVHSVTDLHWYGDSITIEPTSQFDDVKRGVDDVMQIKKEGESSFLGLGIDVTYRGLLSNQYREKLFTLLHSIKDGYQTKIKYFKNNEGEPMKEFSIPKTILFFDMKDVKDLAYMVKNIDSEEISQEFKNSTQKTKVMNQLIIQCEILASFAEDAQNPVFRKYNDVLASIKELSWTNPDIKEILDTRHEDDVSKHIRFLIEEFKSNN